MENHIDTIISFVTNQMDGDQVPCSGSKTLSALSDAIRSLQNDATDHDLHMLALRTMRVVIDRVRSNIEAEKTLHAFLRGGDRG